jgi:cell division protein FtsQ
VPSPLASPRTRPPALGDLGERAMLVAGQPVGRPRRRPRPGRAARLARGLGGAALLLLVPAALSAVGYWLATTPRLAVTAIEVRGAGRVPPARILAAAAIEPGTSILRVDPAEVGARVETVPEIRRADVTREFPNRVVIHVEERRPFTLVHAGRLHWLDEEGRWLGASAEAVAPPVPVISGLPAEELRALGSAPGPRARAALTLLRTLLRSGGALAAEISEIDMSRRDGPVLYTVDGVEVRLGVEDWDARLARLEGVLGQVATGDVRLVDLRFRDQVVLGRGEAR